jgi:WhiB family redox-sensing transcriptional regulator
VTSPEPGQIWVRSSDQSRYRIDRVHETRVTCEHLSGPRTGSLVSLLRSSFTGPNPKLHPEGHIPAPPLRDPSQDLSWMDYAACLGVDPEAFFPVSTVAVEAEPALRVCRRCQVRDRCLRMAERIPQTIGVWGGTTTKDRALARRRADRKSC